MAANPKPPMQPKSPLHSRTAIKPAQQVKTLSKNQYSQACTARWDDWKKAGNAPKTRTEAIKLISQYCKALGNPQSLQTVLDDEDRAASLDIDPTTGYEELSSRLSFIVWDLTENNGKALNYTVETNFFSGLLRQAGLFLYTYTRARIAKVRTTMPTVVYRPGLGATLVANMSKPDLDAMVKEFIQANTARLLAWKTFGADVLTIKRAIRRLYKAALAAF
jgi:hypothetical protein